MALLVNLANLLLAVWLTVPQDGVCSDTLHREVEGSELAQLARDTVTLCYTPFYYGSGDEICKNYVFASTFNNGANSWHVSREYCQSLHELLGANFDLVAIESKQENQVIKQHIETLYPDKNWWTSGNDNATGHVYVWAATGYGFTYYDWHLSQNRKEPSDSVLFCCCHYGNYCGMNWDRIL